MYKSIAIHARSTFWTNTQSVEELTIDSDDLAHEIDKQCNDFEKDGFAIVSIVPVTSGNTTGGNGYYRTESVIITAYKK